MDALKNPSRALSKQAGLLKQKKYRKQENLSTVEGNKLIEEALAADIPLHSVFFTEKCAGASERLIDNLRDNHIDVYGYSPGEMERVSNMKSPPGCLAIYRTDFIPEVKTQGFVLAIHKISDPGNLGTIIRTADWFGASKIYLAPESAELHNPSTVRGSMGAVFRLPIYEDADLSEIIRSLKSDGYFVIHAATEGGNPPHKTERKTAVLLGDEQGNLPDDLKSLADEDITIPRIGNGESLNISIASGILFYTLNQ